VRTLVARNQDSTVPIVFLGSHADRESQRQVSQDEALFLAEKLNCGWLECSAKTGQNVNDAFELIVRMINRYTTLQPPPSSASSSSADT
jgi:GTPase SAR1 family protein